MTARNDEKKVTYCELLSEFAARAQTALARLIRKVYEADPLECPYGQRE